jgi:predicted RNase H-like HicB family nuclease
MTQAYKVIIEPDTQGGYVATFPELLGHQAQAESLKTLMERIREALAHVSELGEPVATPHPPAPPLG